MSTLKQFELHRCWHVSGNPPNWLGLSQSVGCWKLILKEVEELNPAIVLLVTGGWMDERRLQSISARRRESAAFVKH
jgi:hypothetical protein